MKLFTCPQCANTVHFGNLGCEHCGTQVAYDVWSDAVRVARPRECVNRSSPESCDWTVDVGEHFCASCRLDTDHRPTAERHPFQDAKRRTVRQLVGMSVAVSALEPELRFELAAGTEDRPVTTGHADGLITLDVAESDPAHREELRASLGEPYRTPLGHVRHELGHWWWSASVGWRYTYDEFRELFGDEREDYSDALRRHYDAPDDGSWRDRFVSHYAAAHPWEDFAESFAHYLHMTDTSETARAYGLAGPAANSFDEDYARWVELATALNDLDRSMGVPDAYPFAVAPLAVDKIRFVASSLMHLTHDEGATSRLDE